MIVTEYDKLQSSNISSSDVKVLFWWKVSATSSTTNSRLKGYSDILLPLSDTGNHGYHRDHFYRDVI